MKKNFRALRILAPFLLLAVTWSLYRWLEESNDYYRFHPEVSVTEPPFFFQEVAEEMGVQHRTENYIFSPKIKNYKYMSPTINYVSAGDINADGFVDLIFTTGIASQPLKVYLSDKGQKFTDATQKYGLESKDSEKTVAYLAALIDYNNDGWLDLYVIYEGGHDVFRNNKGENFESVGKDLGVDQIFNRTTGVTIADLDRDGYLDMYFTRLFQENPLNRKRDDFYFIPRINKSRAGTAGVNYLLQNRGGQRFEAVDAGSAGNGLLAWSSGASDYNDDGFPDLLVANDLSVVRIYENRKGKGFRNRTYQTLGSQYNSANMSIETGDYNNDARIDFFVSNISRSTYTPTSFNFLFRGLGEGRFSDVSQQAGVDRCAWAWGSKFLDPDFDGQLDLFVVNGMFNAGTKPYWYKWSVYSSLPQYLVNDADVLPNTASHNLEAETRNCLFWQKSPEQFIDITSSVGIHDKLNGRGIAVVDLENDGSFDLVVSNNSDRPLIYKQTQKPTDNHWIGLSFRGTKSNRFGIGAKVYLSYQGIRRVAENFPTNGFSAQSDSRMLFGIGKAQSVSVEVHWPSGKVQKIDDLKIDQYNEITEM